MDIPAENIRRAIAFRQEAIARMESENENFDFHIKKHRLKGRDAYASALDGIVRSNCEIIARYRAEIAEMMRRQDAAA